MGDIVFVSELIGGSDCPGVCVSRLLLLDLHGFVYDVVCRHDCGIQMPRGIAYDGAGSRQVLWVANTSHDELLAIDVSSPDKEVLCKLKGIKAPGSVRMF